MQNADNGTMKISGTVETVIFSNEENGYTICDIATEDDDLVTAVGYLPYISAGDSVVLYGKWVHNPKYGKQFSAESFERTLPADKASMLRYLSSGTIKGIGPKTARRIIDEFGEEAFDVIENHPDYLAQLPGISMKKAADICEDFKNKAGMRQTMLFFRQWFGAALTVRIFKKWGGVSVDIAKSNPYALCENIDGVGFETVDKMAEGLGISHDSKERIGAGVVYTLLKNERLNGHMCMPREELVSASAALLGVSAEQTDEAISRLLKLDKLYYSLFEGQKLIYTPHAYEEECYIAEKLEKIEHSCPQADISDISVLIDKAELESGICYAALQKKAISDALASGVTILTGGPGTGKTTVIRALIRIFEGMDMDVSLAAPTGRAAKRMSEATSHEAKTIHRLLGMGFTGDGDRASMEFAYDENNTLDTDVVVIDETSMIDSFLMSSLLRAMAPGTRLILIGDSDQLPSVGAGNILRDIIRSNRFATVSLTEIFRQAQRSLIITNAHAVNNGKMPELDVKNNDFFFMQRRNDRDAATTIAELYSKRLPNAYGSNAQNGIQVICPSRRGEAGTENLNVVLQAAINPPDAKKREYKHHDVIFREGDRVMQTKNNYETEWHIGKKNGFGIYNGDIGIIKSISKTVMLIMFDEKEVEYDLGQLDELEPAYAITVHKSQGSEYPTVIMPVCSAPPVLLTRNLLYTAITRAQTRVILVGREETVKAMVSNDRQSTRYTGLYYRLIK